MDKIITNGLVIRQTNYAEADRILSIFTEDMGIVSAIAKGARRYKSRQGYAAQFLCYSQFTLRPGKNMYTLQGASLNESFYSLSDNIEKLALATYMCDITGVLCAAEMPEPEMLKLVLNTLYILAKKPRNILLIKAAFELKLLALAGFEAHAGACVMCGNDSELEYFSHDDGGAVCTDCSRRIGKPLPATLSETVRRAIGYICANGADKIYAFEVDASVLAELSQLAERFLLVHCDRDFYSLDYWKTISS